MLSDYEKREFTKLVQVGEDGMFHMPLIGGGTFMFQPSATDDEFQKGFVINAEMINGTTTGRTSVRPLAGLFSSVADGDSICCLMHPHDFEWLVRLLLSGEIKPETLS